MEVYVVGSLRFNVDGQTEDKKGEGQQEQPKELTEAQKQEQRRFIAASQSLGYALAKAGHIIRVGLVQWSTLEDGSAIAGHVINGASEAGKELNKKTRVIFDVPKDPNQSENAAKAMEDLAALPGISLHCRFLRLSPSQKSLTQELETADTFILMGGYNGTDRIGYAAHAMGKPVIAIISFGRAAEELYKDILFDAYGDEVAEEVSSLRADWKDEESPEGQAPKPEEQIPKAHNRAHADRIVDLTEHLAATYRERSRKGLMTLGVTIGGICLLLAGWVAIYILASQSRVDQTISFYLLLYLSAALGTGLRMLASYQAQETTQLKGRLIAMELAIALVIAFGLALIYLIGGISFTGQVVVFPTTPATVPPGAGAVPPATVNPFPTIAITMSLLGLAAGYLVPLAQLRKRLEKVIAEEDDHQPG